MEKNNTEEILKELAKFLFDNGVSIVKSANAENKLVVSIHRTHGIYDDYEFKENITEEQIKQGDFIKLD